MPDIPTILKDVEAVESWSKKASRGPWVAHRRGYVIQVKSEAVLVPIVNWQGFDDAQRDIELHWANAGSIAIWQQKTPRLCQHIRELAAEVERLQERLSADHTTVSGDEPIQQETTE